MRLYDEKAIEAAELHGLPICKHSDPTEGYRTGLTSEEAEQVCEEADGLVYVDLPATGQHHTLHESYVSDRDGVCRCGQRCPACVHVEYKNEHVCTRCLHEIYVCGKCESEGWTYDLDGRPLKQPFN